MKNGIYKIKKTNKLMKVLYTNADQFLNKKEDFLMFLQGNNPDIIMITENSKTAKS